MMYERRERHSQRRQEALVSIHVSSDRGSQFHGPGLKKRSLVRPDTRNWRAAESVGIIEVSQWKKAQTLNRCRRVKTYGAIMEFFSPWGFALVVFFFPLFFFFSRASEKRR
ncbi:uncharacterized protein LOC122536232 [Frieseomelitta varia]|uniref:uncharacterized protein LOC122536232 n=1 Tax=Frieseomelitta varia TaxID=561572 RepID=UPI001CB68F0E|nr:uncharacterized protein LOC122536232 [Frieseomelitta varia]